MNISLLYKVASKSLIDSPFKTGAVLMKGGSIISIGVNHVGSHFLMRKYLCLRPKTNTIHAELDAILGVSKHEAQKCTLYVARLYSDGSFALAKPCVMCQAILKEMGIRTVYYTTGNGNELSKVRL